MGSSLAAAVLSLAAAGKTSALTGSAKVVEYINLYKRGEAMELKDCLTIGVSVLAIAVSLLALIVSTRKKDKEDERTLRLF
jgi:hypothetical protein